MTGLRIDPWLPPILLAGLLLRLIGIDEALIDQQAWRQADTAAMARNFFAEGYDLLRPRIDWRGASTGVVETNFPLYPFLVACLYGLAGSASEWLARLLSALLSVATAVPLYALARRLSPEPWLARWAAALYLILPLSWFFGRAVMPEALMLLLSVASLWGFQRWLDSPTDRNFLLAVLLAGLCFAVKIPTLYLGFPLVAMALARHGWGFVRQPRMWAYLALSLIPAALWYHHAISLFDETGLTFGIFGNTGYDKFDHGLLLSSAFWTTMAQRFALVVLTPVGCVLALAGIFRPWASGPGHRDRWYLYAWLGGLIAYLLLVPEGNRKLHYYQLPFVPLVALLAATPLAALSTQKQPGRRLLVLAALLGVGAASAHEVADYYRPPTYGYYASCLAAGRALDTKLPNAALVVVGDLDDNAGAPFRAQSPTLLYYMNRKGWQITPDEFSAAALDSLATLGAQYFVVPGGFVLQQTGAAQQAFWTDMLHRGVATAASWPEAWHDEAAFLRGANRHSGPERHVLAVRLQGQPQDPRR